MDICMVVQRTGFVRPKYKASSTRGSFRVQLGLHYTYTACVQKIILHSNFTLRVITTNFNHYTLDFPASPCSFIVVKNVGMVFSASVSYSRAHAQHFFFQPSTQLPRSGITHVNRQGNLVPYNRFHQQRKYPKKFRALYYN